MEAVFSPPRAAIVLAACAVGIAVSWPTQTLFGLLAPTGTLFMFARGRTVPMLHAASATGLAGSLLIAASFAGAVHDVAVWWAAFFAMALCEPVFFNKRMVDFLGFDIANAHTPAVSGLDSDPDLVRLGVAPGSTGTLCNPLNNRSCR